MYDQQVSDFLAYLSSCSRQTKAGVCTDEQTRALPIEYRWSFKIPNSNPYTNTNPDANADADPSPNSNPGPNPTPNPNPNPNTKPKTETNSEPESVATIKPNYILT